MKRVKRIIWRTFLAFFILFVISIASATIFVITHEKELIAAFEQEINKQVQTEILIKSSEISFIESFPNVSIHLENLRMKGSHPTSEEYLAHFQNLYLDFNIIELLEGNYSIERVHAYKGGVYLFVDSTGTNNYSFYESKKKDTAAQKEEVHFNIDFIELKDVSFVYHDDKLGQIYAVEQLKGEGRFGIKGDKLTGKLDFNTVVDKFQIGESNYFIEKELEVSTEYVHDLKTLDGIVKPSVLLVNGSQFNVDGEVQPNKDRYFFNVKSPNTTITTLLSLLPNDLVKPMLRYKSKGDVDFSSKILKKPEDEFPAINAKFGLKNVSLQEPNTDYKISKLSLRGEFTNGKKRGNSTSGLFLKNIVGYLDSKQFKGNLALTNFDDLHVKTDLVAHLDLVPVARFVNRSQVAKLEGGTADFDFHLDARIKDLEQGNKDKIKSSGEIAIHDLDFIYRNRKIKKLNSHLIFNDNSIAIADLSTKIENSDFNISGLIINPFSALLHGQKEMLIEMNCNSDYIEVDSLVRYFVIDEPDSEESTSPQDEIRYLAALRLTAKKLKFNQFNLKDLHGELAFHHDILTMPKIHFEEADGYVEIQAKVDLRNKEKIDCHVLGNVEKVDVQKVFNLFENFDQEFIVAENLEGKLSVDFKSHFRLNAEYEVDANSIQLTAGCVVDDGKLLDFEPMQRMSAFVKREELASISFKDIENTISIDTGVINIPEMDIHSSVSNIVISGTHSFDQEINYRLKVPLKNFSAPDKDAVFGAIEDDGAASIVHLKITGTTDDYKIAYDGKATRNKIKENIRSELKELKQLISGKMNTDSIQQTELEEDEYFEF